MTVDDVRIYYKALTPAEVADLHNNPTDGIAAGAPTPANGETEAYAGTTLSWTAGSLPGYVFDVYFGTDYNAVLNATTASPEYVGQQAGTSFTPSTSADTRYYWRVDTISGAGTVTGDVWWFDTSTDTGGLADPALLNGGFEDPALAAGASDNDLKDWYDAVAYTFTFDDSGGTGNYPDTPDGDNWAEIDRLRWLYQQIGTYGENRDIRVDFLLGKRADKNCHGVTTVLYAGGNPALAADANVKLDNGNPLVDTVGAAQVVQSLVIPGPVDSTPVEHSVTLSTGTGHGIGSPLWLQFEVSAETGRKTLIDNIRISDVTDSDSDGMPDVWEEQYFTNGIAALPNGNADGDPQDNLAEFIAGMNPTNAGSFFQILEHGVETNGPVVVWNSVSNRPLPGGLDE